MTASSSRTVVIASDHAARLARQRDAADVAQFGARTMDPEDAVRRKIRGFEDKYTAAPPKERSGQESQACRS